MAYQANEKQRPSILRQPSSQVSAPTLNRLSHLTRSSQTSPYSGGSSPLGTPTTGPPANFGVVITGIYRSGLPCHQNIGCLWGLKLRAVLSLVATEIDSGVETFMRDEDIKHYRVIVPPHKDGMTTTQTTLAQVMQVMMNRANHPMLVHCNKGRHRTGCMVACFRLLNEYLSRSPCPDLPRALMSSFSTNPEKDYDHYAAPKPRDTDKAYIRSFSAASTTLLMRTLLPEPFTINGLPHPIPHPIATNPDPNHLRNLSCPMLPLLTSPILSPTSSSSDSSLRTISTTPYNPPRAVSPGHTVVDQEAPVFTPTAGYTAPAVPRGQDEPGLSPPRSPLQFDIPNLPSALERRRVYPVTRSTACKALTATTCAWGEMAAAGGVRGVMSEGEWMRGTLAPALARRGCEHARAHTCGKGSRGWGYVRVVSGKGADGAKARGREGAEVQIVVHEASKGDGGPNGEGLESGFEADDEWDAQEWWKCRACRTVGEEVTPPSSLLPETPVKVVETEDEWDDCEDSG